MGPGGEIYPNEGQATLSMVHAKAGRPCTGEFQVAEGLTKALMAVSDCNDKGNVAVFDNGGSGIIPRESPEGREIRRLTQKALARQAGVQVERKNGVFIMPMWLAPPPEPGFTGQAKK